MTAATVHELRPAKITTTTIELSDGAYLTVTDHVPDGVVERRALVRRAQLYAFAGLLAEPGSEPTGLLGSYLGKSAALTRADASYRHWVLVQRCLAPTGMALIHRDTPYPPPVLSYVEARCIQNLSSGPRISMLNTHSAANLAGARLSRDQLFDAMDLADEITEHLHTYLFHARTNPPDAPVPNSREAAIRVVLAARRALDVYDIAERLTAAGWHRNAITPDRSVRRDLTQRLDRGDPRVHVGWHHGQRLWWSPALERRAAIARYDARKAVA